MRTLDLNAYGVYEMNDVEMRDADGGGWLGALLLIGGLIGVGVAAGQTSFKKAAAIGYPSSIIACIGLALL